MVPVQHPDLTPGKAINFSNSHFVLSTGMLFKIGLQILNPLIQGSLYIYTCLEMPGEYSNTHPQAKPVAPSQKGNRRPSSAASTAGHHIRLA